MQVMCNVIRGTIVGCRWWFSVTLLFVSRERERNVKRNPRVLVERYVRDVSEEASAATIAVCYTDRVEGIRCNPLTRL